MPASPHLVQLVRLAPAWDQPDIRAACLALPATIAALPPEAVIYRGRNTLTRFTLADREVVAKAFPAPRTLLKRVQRLGRASKAVRAFDHAAHMQRLGIGTPEPFAALESADGAAWYICAWADDCRPAWHLHDSKVPDSDRWCDELGAFVGRMHEAGAYHFDSTPGNILFRVQDNSCEFFVVDCNRMRFGNVSAWSGLRSLAQLQCQGRLLAGYCRARGWSVASIQGMYDFRLSLHRWIWRMKNGTRPLRRKIGF